MNCVNRIIMYLCFIEPKELGKFEILKQKNRNLKKYASQNMIIFQIVIFDKAFSLENQFFIFENFVNEKFTMIVNFVGLLSCFTWKRDFLLKTKNFVICRQKSCWDWQNVQLHLFQYLNSFSYPFYCELVIFQNQRNHFLWNTRLTHIFTIACFRDVSFRIIRFHFINLHFFAESDHNKVTK